MCRFKEIHPKILIVIAINVALLGKKSTMRSKVTNENTWEAKWTTESSRSGRSVRRATKRMESSRLKLSKPSRGNTARERTLRRLESNERERMRMHSLNDAFQVHIER